MDGYSSFSWLVMVICYTTGCLRGDGKRLEHENTSFLMFSGDIKNFLDKVKQRGLQIETEGRDL